MIPANTRRRRNVGLQLAHRLQRCTSSKPTLGEYIVLAVIMYFAVAWEWRRQEKHHQQQD